MKFAYCQGARNKFDGEAPSSDELLKNRQFRANKRRNPLWLK
ncbi:hypothetical protein QWZ13_02170 [Reinekea marina]|nr:hypothetical protein [Reinekea marina]MDN3647713.1 hypothetical protein [Reinekea marina]